MDDLAPQLQLAFSVASITSGFWLFGIFFTVCSSLHTRIRGNEESFRLQHNVQIEVTGINVWESMTQKGLLDQRKLWVDKLGLWIRLSSGFSVSSGIVGLLILWLKDSYGIFDNLKIGTLAALAVELVPFVSLVAVVVMLFVTYRAISLARFFAKTSGVAIQPSNIAGPNLQ